jgi:hypothetical protein
MQDFCSASLVLKKLLPINQHAFPKVLPVQPEQIKSVEIGLAATKEQFVEQTVPVTAQTYNLSVRNCIFHRQVPQGIIQ